MESWVGVTSVSAEIVLQKYQFRRGRRCSIFDESCFFWCGGIALVDGPLVEVARRNAAEGQDAVGAAGDAGSNGGFGPNPNPIFQGDCACDEVKRGFLVVVIAAEQQRALRNANMIADAHLGEVVNPNLFADPHVASYGELPRIFDGDPRLDDDALSDFGSEEAEP